MTSRSSVDSQQLLSFVVFSASHFLSLRVLSLFSCGTSFSPSSCFFLHSNTFLFLCHCRQATQCSVLIFHSITLLYIHTLVSKASSFEQFDYNSLYLQLVSCLIATSHPSGVTRLTLVFNYFTQNCFVPYFDQKLSCPIHVLYMINKSRHCPCNPCLDCQ